MKKHDRVPLSGVDVAHLRIQYGDVSSRMWIGRIELCISHPSHLSGKARLDPNIVYNALCLAGWAKHPRLKPKKRTPCREYDITAVRKTAAPFFTDPDPAAFDERILDA